MRKTIYLFIMMLLGVSVLEAGLHLVNAIIEQDGKEELKKPYLLTQYKGKAWAKGLFDEIDMLSGSYRAYRGWGKDEFKGDYINIAPDGSRKTWNQKISDERAVKTIYVFGGSTSWGFGARDDYTIPSFISKLLYNKGYKVKVYNYGEWAYSFTQSLFYLINLLRDGANPDYVIFFGVTDVYNAYKFGETGHLKHGLIIGGSEEISNLQHIKIGILNIIRSHSMIYKELSKIVSKFEVPKSKFQEVAHNYDDDRLLKLAVDTVNYLEQSHRLLDKLSSAYNFQYISAWSPGIFTEENLTEEEADSNERLNDEAIKKLNMNFVEILNTRSIPHFYNISDIFKGRTRPYYIDSGHYTEEGNEVVAKKIVSIFEKEHLLNE